MAATITTINRMASNRIMVDASLAADTSYPTGGYAVTPQNFGLSKIDSLHCDPQAGYTGTYIPATGKIILYSTAATEVANTTNLSAVITAMGLTAIGA